MSDSTTQPVKDGGKNAAVADPASAKGAKDAKSTDSLLDVFTTEDFKESATSTLCKDLGDVSIQSLLEQTRQLAHEIGCGH